MRSPEAEQFIEMLRAQQQHMSSEVSIDDLRKRLEHIITAMHPAPDFATYTPQILEGAPVEITRVKESRPGKAILHLHGGAFKMGSASQDRHLTAQLARCAGVHVVAVDYALAPENQFPVALEQCIAAYRGLLATGYQATDVVIAGVSAGGTLALATMLALKDRGLPLPAAVVAVSAATYLDSAEGTHTTNKPTDVVLGNEDVPADVLALYAPAEDPRDPYISPLYGDYAGASPLLIVVGTDEVFHDDALLLVEKARAAGVEVESIIGEGMPHAYPVFFDVFPEAAAALTEICEYVSTRLASVEQQAAFDRGALTS